MQKDAAVHKRVDELTNMTESTFKVINERFEEMVRVSRARMGQIEKDLVEGTAGLRADCRSEIERVRADYEQEAARLDVDLGDLHTKYDVAKQEIGFLQEKVVEHREWAQRQLTETATATRAVQVDSQEGLAATTKMLNALRDDAVAFREKMGNYVGILQHTSDKRGDAIVSLEAQRGKIRHDLDVLAGDHKAYTGDMDSWADDVRAKVERLFRALEPSKGEWRIHRAHKRAKDLKKPLAIKSPVFSVRGLKEVQLEFFPEGTNNSPEGKAVLRAYLPKGALVRFQIWVGFSSDGPMETKPNGSLAFDMFVDDWQSQIQDDGSLPVVLTMLKDLTEEDESLSTEVRIESH
uniref:MATH domain-containing protein n=1 Tax=Zooxanthella nutricula TaxID=1333877 RepID=A0A7S2JDK7_9DINO